MKDTYKSSKVAPKGSSKKTLKQPERLDTEGREAADRQGVIDKLKELAGPIIYNDVQRPVYDQQPSSERYMSNQSDV